VNLRPKFGRGKSKPKADASDGEWDTPLHYLWLVIPKTLISFRSDEGDDD
jgi:hypothetical protein